MPYKEYYIPNPGWDKDEAPLPRVRYTTFLQEADLSSLLSPRITTTGFDYLYAGIVSQENGLCTFYGSARLHRDLQDAVKAQEKIQI